MNNDEIAAMIGGAPKLPDSDQLHRSKTLRMVAGGKGTFVDAGELKRPVTINFLAQVFDMDPATVKKRLLRLPPLATEGTEKAPKYLYDFKAAVSYLLPPKMNIADYIKSLDPNKLPNHINKVFWEAQRTRLRFFVETGQAWATEDVFEGLGRFVMLTKDRALLVPEHLRETGAADEICEQVRELLEKFLADLHKELAELQTKRQTMHIFANEASLGPDATTEAVSE